MERKPAWRRYLRLFGANPAADFDDELQFHLDSKIDELTAAGYSPRQARDEALRQFGPVWPIRRECVRISRDRLSQISRSEYFAGWMRDVRYAVRSLRRMKASALTALLILAVGIGANTAVFTLLDRLLLAPLPVPHPSQLVRLSDRVSPPGGGASVLRETFTSQAFDNLRDHNRALTGLAAEASVRVAERRGREKIVRPAEGLAVSGNYFQMLGLNAQLGRILGPADASSVAVISCRFWTYRFNQSPDAVGRTIHLNDTPYIVVGVLPCGFFGLHRSIDFDVYVTIASLPRAAANMFGDGRWLNLFGRLRPGVKRLAACANLQSLMPTDERIEMADLSRGSPGAWGDQRRSLWLLAAIVAVLLLMGCANVACLLLARGAARHQEMAIRLSLGGKRARIVRQSLLESCLLAFAGGAAGLVFAFVAERLLVAAFQWQDRPVDFSLDARVLGFGTALSLITGLLFGLAPAMQLWRSGRIELARGQSLTPRFGLGKVLVVVEVALSMVLLAGATVFLRSFQSLRAVPTGFSTAHVSFIELGNNAETDALSAPYRDGMIVAESVRRAPGVEAASLSDLLTFDDGSIRYPVTVPGDSREPAREVHVLRVDGQYFGALKISLQTGRTFTPRDDLDAPKVAILSDGTARRLFRGGNPLGRRIVLGTAETEIVGIVNDIKFGSLTAPAPDVVFQPLLQGQNNGATTSSLKLQVRSRLKPADVAALVRSRIRDMGLAVSVDRAAPLEDAISHTIANDRIRMQASGVFGMLALLLIAAGIYGLMAYSVATRTREIGIRIAVGSQPGKIVAMVLRQGSQLVAAGVILGTPCVLVVMKAISRLVFGLAPIDWTSVAVAVLILSVTGILASLAPAWRAAHLDPVEALRVIGATHVQTFPRSGPRHP